MLSLALPLQCNLVRNRLSFRHRSSRRIMPIPLAVFVKDPLITDLAQVGHLASLLPGMAKPPIRKTLVLFLAARGRDRKDARMPK